MSLLLFAPPPVHIPGTIELPNLPAGSPAGMAVAALVALLTAGSIIGGTQDPPKPKRIPEDYPGSANRVITIAEAGKAVDDTISTLKLGAMIARFFNPLREAPHGWFDADTLSHQEHNEVFGPFVDDCMREFIKRALQQGNPRFQLKKPTFARRGALH